jgi:hypothetical protein
VVAARTRLPGWVKATLGLAAAAAVVAAVLVATGVGEEERERTAREGRERAAARAALLRRIEREQAPRREQGRRPSGRLSVAQEQAARRRLLGDVEAAVLSDARARVRARELRGPILSASCEPYPPSVSRTGAETDVSAPAGRYECLAVTSRVPATERNPAGAVGYPFLVRVDFERFSYAFCKVSPPPGELAIPGPELPRVPRACTTG